MSDCTCMYRGVYECEMDEYHVVELPNAFASVGEMDGKGPLPVFHLVINRAGGLEVHPGAPALGTRLEAECAADEEREYKGTSFPKAPVWLGLSAEMAFAAGLRPVTVLAVGLGRSFKLWAPARYDEKMEEAMAALILEDPMKDLGL